MSKEQRSVRMSDEELVKETRKKLQEMKELLLEIRDALKTAGGIE